MLPEGRPRLVVTGASGFIGTHLIRLLEREGLPVVAIVRETSTNRPDRPGVQYVARDLERVDTLSDVLQPADVVVHLAARVHRMHVDHSTSLASYRAANVEPMRVLCASAVERGVRRIVFLSSAKVFGEGREQPYSRTDPVAPVEPYGMSKVEAEQVLRAAGETGSLEWTILRPPFVYGAGGKGNFPRLVALARLAGLVPLPLGSIENRRSMIYVGNLADLILRASLHAGAGGRVLLPSDGTDVSTRELLRAIGNATARPARLFPCPLWMLRAGARAVGRSADIDRLTESLRLDSRHLREELGWHPPFSLESALARSLEKGDPTSVAPRGD